VSRAASNDLGWSSYRQFSLKTPTGFCENFLQISAKSSLEFEVLFLLSWLELQDLLSTIELTE
jgi:hypothetical protein